MDYSFYYRNELQLDESWDEWDLFISAFNLSHRLQSVYEKVSSIKKVWLAFPEYQFSKDELPYDQDVICVDPGDEASQFRFFANILNLESFKGSKICVDTTGFMRPQLLFVLLYFKRKAFKSVDFLYSEPSTYINKEKTQFTYGAVSETRPISGYSGINKAVDGRDLLIIAAGYDGTLIGKVAQYKENAEIVHIFGFPSLRPDMYQENILRTVAEADSFTGNAIDNPLFAPASDPFETASVIKRYIDSNNCLEKYRHIYISPLSTKAQTLGVGLVFLNEYQNLPVSIIFPFTDQYKKETSQGLGKMWQYTVEFD
jgi:hypothetical protein